MISKTNLRLDIIERFMPVGDLQKLLFNYEQHKKSLGQRSVELPEDFDQFGKAYVKGEMKIEDVAEHYGKTHSWADTRLKKWMRDQLTKIGM